MSREEKLMILQLLSEGKITPEQGVELLKAVGEEKPQAVAAPKPQFPPVPALNAPPAPKAPTPPKVTVVTTGGMGPSGDLSQNIQIGIENAARAAEDAAHKAAAQAETWASKIAEQATEMAGRVAGEGENLGKILGESGENIGKIIARIFTGSGFDGPEFEFHENLTGDLPVSGEINVNLSTTNGRIVVDTWEGEGFRLDVRKVIRAANEAEAKVLSKNGFEYNHDGLSITARSKHSGEGMNLFRSVNIGFTLSLPRDRAASLRLASSNGRISVGGISGSHLYASTSNGRVEVEECKFQSSEVSSANGRIEFDGTPGDFTASTANGRVVARLAGTGNWRMNSANGRIEVEVVPADDIAYLVEATTMMGKVSVEGMENSEVLLDESQQRGGSRRYQAQTRGYSDAAKKVAIRASTSMGKVTVKF